MADIMDKFWSAPPVSRTIVAAMFAQSALVYGAVLNAYRILFYPSTFLALPPQLWRLLTPFLLTGRGFNFVIDLYLSEQSLTDKAGLQTLMSKKCGLTAVVSNLIHLASPSLAVSSFLSASWPRSLWYVTHHSSFVILYFLFLYNTSHNLPAQPFDLAEAVPGNEGDYPYGACRSIIRKTVKDCMWYGHGGGFFEKAMRDSAICVRRLRLPTFSSVPALLLMYSIWLRVLTLLKVLAGLLLGAVVFTPSLMLAFIYIFAQDNRGAKAHFVILQIPVELLPWAMLTLTLIMSGPSAAMRQVTGVLAAHLYDFLTRLYPTFQGGRNIIYTPTAIRRFFGGGVQSRATTYGQAIRPVQTNQQPQSRSWTSGFSNSWGGRGAGRRLGGD